MTWAGELLFGDSWAIFRGEAADNVPHAHAAIQVALAEDGELTVFSGEGDAQTGRAFAIRPLVEHSLGARGVVTLLYVEPQAQLAFRIADIAGDHEIAALDPALLGFEPGCTLKDWSKRLAAIADETTATVDTRLSQALASLADEPGAVSIAQSAAFCNLSESRLRTLAREQLGLPLSTWLIWRKLERAARALHDGEPLAAAATVGGFADQAHLARAMRRMFGITPRTAQRATTPPQSSRSVQD